MQFVTQNGDTSQNDDDRENPKTNERCRVESPPFLQPAEQAFCSVKISPPHKKPSSLSRLCITDTRHGRDICGHCCARRTSDFVTGSQKNVPLIYDGENPISSTLHLRCCVATTATTPVLRARAAFPAQLIACTAVAG